MTTEHDLAHGRSAPRAPSPADDDLMPGRGSRSSQLAAPSHPIAGGLLLRKARDANGVAEGAEGAVAAAASSSGHALPEPIMRKFESSLGADLSSVRVHTGGESQAAAASVGARAYAVGQNIHFGAGQYDPISSAGQHLLAHEVAHTQQQTGGAPNRQHKLEVSSPGDSFEHEADRAADAMIMGAPTTVSGASSLGRVVVQREGLSHGSTASTTMSSPPDMVEMNWGSGMIAPAKGPEEPGTINIDLGPVPPAPGANPKLYGPPDCGPRNGAADAAGPLAPHNQKTWDDGSDRAFMIYAERESNWQALSANVKTLVSTWNQTSPLIANYNKTSKDPELAKVYGISSSGTENLDAQAEAKVVAGPAKGGTTVGNVFPKGSAVADTKSVDKNIDTAGAGDVNSPLAQALGTLKGFDQKLIAQIGFVKSANDEAAGHAHDVAAADFHVEEVKVEAEKAEADERLENLQKKAEEVKGYATKAAKGVMFVAGLALAPEVAIPAAAAGAASSTPEDKKGGVPEGAEEASAKLAEKLVGYWYAGDLSKAQVAIDNAVAAYRTAKKNGANEAWLGNCSALSASLAKIEGQMAQLKSITIERRGAFRAVASAAAKAGGGSPEQQEKMQGLILAIPVCETVVNMTSNIVSASNDGIVYSRPAGVAFGMAMNSSSGAAIPAFTFTEKLGQLRGYKQDFEAKNQLWSSRLGNLRGILVRLGINNA